nr:MAG TPA: hypothetical protein [Caudoviricetes sp.]
MRCGKQKQRRGYGVAVDLPGILYQNIPQKSTKTRGIQPPWRPCNG